MKPGFILKKNHFNRILMLKENMVTRGEGVEWGRKG